MLSFSPPSDYIEYYFPELETRVVHDHSRRQVNTPVNNLDRYGRGTPVVGPFTSRITSR